MNDLESTEMGSLKLSELVTQFSDQVSIIEEREKRDADEIKALKAKLEMIERAYESISQEKETIGKQLAVATREREDIMNTENRVLCLIDGDGTIFSRELTLQGRSGGAESLRRLIKAIKEDINGNATASAQIWIYCFMNVNGLANAAQVPLSKFNEWVSGFNTAHDKSFAIDIGWGKENVDSRIRGLLQHFASSAFTTHIYFGACHDNGYVHDLQAVVTKGFQDKLILLRGYDDMAASIKGLNLRSLWIPDLFEQKRLSLPHPRLLNDYTRVSTSTRSTPISVSVPLPDSDSEQILMPKSSPSSQVEHDTDSIPSNTKYIDWTMALSRHEPPPCFKYYLVGYCKPSGCVFGHDYTLRPGDKEKLAAQAKKKQCVVLKSGRACNFGDQCIYGH